MRRTRTRAYAVLLGLCAACVGDDGSQGASATVAAPESLCGDGVVDPGEACDDGINDGRYDGCMPFCQTRGPYCGNGIVDPEELCDGGDEAGAYGGCASDCQGTAARCGDGVIDDLGPLGLCDDLGCCGERCDADELDDGLRCDACFVRRTDALSGCPAADAPPIAVSVTTKEGTTTLTRAYFGEVYGDSRDPAAITGINVQFIDVTGDPTPGELPSGPSLDLRPSGYWCVEGGIPEAGRWQGTMVGAYLRTDGTTTWLADVTLVVEGKDPDAMHLHGHLEGAAAGTFTAAYCDALVDHVEVNPD